VLESAGPHGYVDVETSTKIVPLLVTAVAEEMVLAFVLGAPTPNNTLTLTLYQISKAGDFTDNPTLCMLVFWKSEPQYSLHIRKSSLGREAAETHEQILAVY
jgi:hypothetical protein